jgi:transposase-like protein
MDEHLYRWECLQRNPEFTRDLATHEHEVLEIMGADFDGAKDRSGWPVRDLRYAEVVRQFRAKYQLADADYLWAVMKPAPFVFDPAWLVAATKVVTSHVGPESGALAPSPDETALSARTIFENMPAIIKIGWRQIYAPTVFAAARMFVPITPTTRLEHLRKLWPEIRRQQLRCYGPAKLATVTRPSTASTRYEVRLRIWDAVEKGRSMREVARAHRLTKSTAYRYYKEAAKDIDPTRVEGLRTSEDLEAHVRSCTKCAAAQAAGTSNEYCPWMQRQLGPRSGRISRAVRLGDDMPEEGYEKTRRQRGRKD